jgi:hypothetical protein
VSIKKIERGFGIMKIRNWKRVISMGLAVCVLLTGILMGTEQPVEAAEKATVTKAVHLYVGETTDRAISVKYVDTWDHIENLKTSSKNLTAKITSTQIDEDSENGNNSSTIGLYANKNGTYKVTFDIYDAYDEKVSSHSVTVYANKDYAIKKITFAGKDMSRLSDVTKGKLSVSMNKGYTLKKIEVQTYDKNGKEVIKTVKNNSTIELSKYAYFYESGKMYEYSYYLNTSLLAHTQISVTYTDKYTKQNRTDSYYMYTVANE